MSNKYMGFDSATDLITSLTKFKNWDFNIIPVAIAAITTFITGYIWDSPEAIWTLWTLMLADYITGIGKSIKNKSFVSFKLFRMPIFFFVTSFILAISWWLSKSSVLFVPLPSLIYGGFAGVFIISLCENLGELGYLPKPLVNILKNRFGLKALINKFDKEPDKYITENNDNKELSE